MPPLEALDFFFQDFHRGSLEDLSPNLFNLQKIAFWIYILIQKTLVCLWLSYSCHRVSHVSELSEPAAHAIRET